jgi:hypothetical protein|tara:strand:+ start:997 stop:2034 length:1038 start_codon:yes stop_codon:yes gene_type:complete
MSKKNLIRGKYKLFNAERIINPNKKYVNALKKPWWNRPTDEKDPLTKKKVKSQHRFTEETLYDVLKAFFPQHYKDGKIIKGKKIPDTRIDSFRPDYRIELTDATSYNEKTKKEESINGIIFEYDGEKHYNSSLHIHSDKLKMKDLERIKYRRIRIPYYIQLTDDLAKFIFNGLMFHFTGQNYYSHEKWREAVIKVYSDPTTNEIISDDDFEKKPYPLIGSPGMHKTEYVPSAFHPKALKLFLKDFEWKSKRPFQNLERHPDAIFPESARHQIIKTLELYIDDTNNGEGGEPDELVLPNKETQDGKKLNEIYHKIKSSYKTEYLEKVFFGRKKYDEIFPELYRNKI